MSGKKLLNTVEKCVDENLEGLVAINPGLRILKDTRVVVRADIEEVKKQGKVAILCGGGSGHEPGHAGYVGEGMLSAAVAGSVFTSPPPHDILAGLRTIAKGNPGGCHVIIPNYTGDRLNFGLGIEQGLHEDIKIMSVTVGEDCAVSSHDKSAGRRGLCGMFLVIKITGALSEEGKSLEEITQQAQLATENMGTIGLALGACSTPGSSGPLFHLEADEMELGLGLHGEAGVKRTKLMTAKETVKLMIDHMTNPASSTHFAVKKGEKVACMINNLGAMSVLEMNVIAKETIQYLDAPTTAPAWPKPLLGPGQTTRMTPEPMLPVQGPSSHEAVKQGASISNEEGAVVYKMLQKVCERLSASEDILNTLDSESGDGDCGSTMARGAHAIKEKLGSADKPGLPVTNPSGLAMELASIVESVMGGSSGGLYSLFFTSAALALQKEISPKTWLQALTNGIAAIQKYGKAEPGDRTMLDALWAAKETLEGKLSQMSAKEAFTEAVKASETAAEGTKSLKAKAGRASYVSANLLTRPDPGATAVAIWLTAVLEAMN